MPSLTLKALPAPLHRSLKARAIRHKRSLNQEVIAMLEAVVAPARRVDVETMIADARRFRETLQVRTTSAEISAFKREGRG
jgi:plasmid stability protein